jgi:hypothetical protein
LGPPLQRPSSLSCKEHASLDSQAELLFISETRQPKGPALFHAMFSYTIMELPSSPRVVVVLLRYIAKKKNAYVFLEGSFSEYKPTSAKAAVKNLSRKKKTNL